MEEDNKNKNEEEEEEVETPTTPLPEEIQAIMIKEEKSEERRTSVQLEADFY